jgi:hypothetical protein
VPSDPPADIARIDEALQAWRRGECVLGEQWFAHRFAPAQPLTDEAKASAEAGVDLAESETRGLMIVSQSCDVVRSCSERPFVEVCPVVQLEEDVFRQVQRGRRPQFAFVSRGRGPTPLAPRAGAGDNER